MSHHPAPLASEGSQGVAASATVPAVDVTVVVPAYQAADSIETTLAMVAAQTAPPAAVIVVDDGSTDGTVGRVEVSAERFPHLRIRLLREPHRGPGAARNAGIHAATSDWIAFLDADDLWHPDKLKVVAEWVRAHPAANIFCSGEMTRYRDGTERVTEHGAGFSPQRPFPEQLYRRNYFSTSAVVCRRHLLILWGGFDQTLSSSQDYEMWLRMSPDLHPIFIPDTLGTYIVRSNSISTTHFIRRLANKYRVAYRHRGKGPSLALPCRIAEITLHHAYQAAPPACQRALLRMFRPT